MKPKKHVKHISVSNESHDRVLFEGSLGILQGLSMATGGIPEIRETNGVLRTDISWDELQKMLSYEEAE